MAVKSKETTSKHHVKHQKSKTKKAISGEDNINEHPLVQKSDLPDPNVLLKIIGVFIIIDCFAFQKTLPGIAVYFLLSIPISLFAVTNYLWARQNYLPIWHPIFPWSNFFSDRTRGLLAMISCIIFACLAILIILFLPFYLLK